MNDVVFHVFYGSSLDIQRSHNIIKIKEPPYAGAHGGLGD